MTKIQGLHIIQALAESASAGELIECGNDRTIGYTIFSFVYYHGEAERMVGNDYVYLPFETQWKKAGIYPTLVNVSALGSFSGIAFLKPSERHGGHLTGRIVLADDHKAIEEMAGWYFETEIKEEV